MTAAPPRGRLARSTSQLWQACRDKLVYDVVIVGSGYGGSVAAHALKGVQVVGDDGKPRNLKVCVLERGREFLPGDFPSRFADLPRELRVGHQTTGEVTGHEGLFDLRLGDDVNALVANGLGGGSLINAGVMLEPREADFPAGPWQTLLRGLKAGGHFRAARRLLGAEVHRNGQWVHNTIERLPTTLPKTEALRALGQTGGCTTTLPPITVAFEAGANRVGLPLNACVLCGDCMTGCNAGAKASLDTNLLAEAADAGCEIYTGVTVMSVRREQGPDAPGSSGLAAGYAALAGGSRARAAAPQHWVLRLSHTDARLQARENNDLRLHARKVILAAGTLGSPEILLRSRDEKLVFSSQLGMGFSCNGDNIAAVRDLAEPTQACADEDVAGDQRGIGPTITAAINMPGSAASGTEPVRQPFLLQEFAVPGPLKRLYDELVTTAGMVGDMPLGDPLPHHGTDADPLAVNPQRMAKTLLVGMIGHDDASGSLRLARPLRPSGGVPQMGALAIAWPDARLAGTALDEAHEAVRALVEQEAKDRPASPPEPGVAEPRPTLVANPAWRLLPPGLEELVSQPRGPVLTVHPLGGCRIGFVGQGDGAVDEHGMVFNAGDPGRDNWQGSLLVLDGSMVPCSLGVNPALTITALALRAMAYWRQTWFPNHPTAQTQAGQAQDLDLGTAAVDAHRASVQALPCHSAIAHPATTPQTTPRRTEIEVVERLWGPVDLSCFPDGAVLELTLTYKAAAVQTLIGPDRQPMPIDPSAARSRLRLYHAKTWEALHLRSASDAERAPHAQVVASFKEGGYLRFFHREPSTRWPRVARGMVAWLFNRGLRDMWQRWPARWGQRFKNHLALHPADLHADVQAGRQDAKPGHAAAPIPPARHAAGRAAATSGLGGFIKLGSKAGEVRRFDYLLAVDKVLTDNVGFTALAQANATIAGHKRLTYARRCNPWHQLTHLALTAFPGLRPGSRPELALDARFLANMGLPLLRITHQRDHAEALAELASFGLYLLRLLISMHLWTFRKPDTALPREPDRLPGHISGLPEPQVTELVVDRWPDDAPQAGQPLAIRLTRYRRADTGDRPPLVLIHGYSVSGNTFTHPSLQPSLAAYFWHRQRDVWVVELRTSTGLASATYPWAMEQPGLIDIPAALMHVHLATGRRLDVLAHCIGGPMLSMALLTDAQQVRNSRIELGVDTWLTAEHLGMLTALNGAQPSGGQHPVVNRIVLSQKGPVLRYTDANILRAFVLQYMRRFLLSDDYQFRPSANPGVAEQLLDRLLSSLPYPAADFDVENPLRPCATTPWTATRHRMDALYGRDFNADNMHAETLEAIDDLFGPIHLDTAAQTIHFARFGAVTNQGGRGEFVTRQRLRDRWRGIPTLAIHGHDNGLVDRHTQVMLESLLKDAAGVPFQRKVFEGMGHQDVLIGKRSREVFDHVADFLGSSLKTPAQPLPSTTKWVCAEPWIGPRIDPPRIDPEAVQKPVEAAVPAASEATDTPSADALAHPLRVACISRPDQGDAWLWLVPAYAHPTAQNIGQSTGQVFSNIGLLGTATGGFASSARAESSGHWIYATPDLAALAGAHGVPEGAVPGWLALFVYAEGETTAHRPPSEWPLVTAGTAAQPEANGAGPSDGAAAQASGSASSAGQPGNVLPPLDNFGNEPSNLPLGPPAATSHHADRPPTAAHAPAAPGAGAGPGASLAPNRPVLPNLAQAAALALFTAWVARVPTRLLESSFVRLDDLQRSDTAARTPPSQPGPLRFMVGSCQYPNGLLDRLPANASLAAVQPCIGDTQAGIDLALLLGDQIYADATAGLVDAERRDELYAQPHERALRLPAMRAMLRRLPCHMLLDDHELSDNWQPPPTGLEGKQAEKEASRLQQAAEHGVAAYLRYQRLGPGRRVPSATAVARRGGDRLMPGTCDDNFFWHGHPFFLLDTRVGRSRGRPSLNPSDDQIVNANQRATLENWLRLHKHRVKFIATPSLLVPRRKTILADGPWRSDAWDGFPDTLAWLLNLLADKDADIRHTVFLSGDEHHAMVSEVWLGEDRRKLVSVHSSALYAPFPFANGRPQDLVACETTTLFGVPIQVRTQFAHHGDGFATIALLTDGPLRLQVVFKKASGEIATSPIPPILLA